jgi:hypothetical protein
VHEDANEQKDHKEDDGFQPERELLEHNAPSTMTAIK